MENRDVSSGLRWGAALLLTGCLSSVVSAQEARVQWVTVKSGPIAVLLDPKPDSVVVGLVTPGTALEVRQIRGEWYWVVLPKDPGEPAARSGWIPAAVVIPSSAPSPAAPPTATPAQPGAKTTPREDQPQPSIAGTSSTDRFFVAVSWAWQESSLAFQDTRTDPFYQETSSWTADYAANGGNGFDAGGGIRLWRGLGAAVAVSRVSDASRLAAIAGHVPHPFWFDRPRSIEGESEGLNHVERAVHVSAHWTLPPIARLTVAAFGGPSFFSIERDLVEDVEFAESYPYHTASYDAALVRSVSETANGFHLGADVSWYFTRQLGAGLLVRYASAEVTLRSPATGRNVSIDVGGAQIGAGVRFRFRGWR